jgi:hypothetical protein
MDAGRSNQDAVFRRGAGGREPLATPDAGGWHVHYAPRRSVGIGCVTSRRSDQYTFYERLALELSGVGGGPVVVPFCTPAQAEELHRRGLIQ